jgi:hypothetical protein
MFKFAAAIVDFYDDPEFIKTAQNETLFESALIAPENTADLPLDAFAVIVKTAAGVHRKFPVYNALATRFSGTYFDAIASQLPEEIRKTAGYFLKNAYAKFQLALPESLTGEFEEPETLFVEYTPDLPQDGIAKTAEDGIRLAEDVFASRSRYLPMLEKVAKAHELVEAANLVDIPVRNREAWDYAPKTAAGPYFKDMLVQRETLLKAAGDNILYEQFQALLDEAVNMDVREIPFLFYQLDKLAGLTDRYGLNGLLDPFYGTWGGSSLPKTAGVETDLKKYKLQTVGRNTTLLHSVFPDKFVQKFTRDPVGCYDEATAAEKKALDFFISKVPSDLSASENSMPSGPGSSDTLAKEVKESMSGLKSQETTPSDRPDHGSSPYGPISEIKTGL